MISSTKGGAVWSLTSDATVYEAIDQLSEKGRALLVAEGSDSSACLRALICPQSDSQRKVSARRTSGRSCPTGNLRPSEYGRTDMALMTEKRVPASGQTKPSGVISIGDVVRAIIEERNTTSSN